MAHQCYIKCDDHYLFACAYIPQRYDRIILLLQGYSHSMTDIDYFMTNIKNELITDSCAVIQFDPFGHGDSDGYIESFNYKTLVMNIRTVVNWIQRNLNNDNIVFITRGLYALAVSDSLISPLFKKSIILNPLCIMPNELCKIDSYLHYKDNIIDFNEWLQNIENDKQEYIESFIYSLGAKLKNLQGQLFNQKTFYDFISRLIYKEQIIPNNQYNIYANSIDDYKICNGELSPSKYNIDYYYKYGALPRDPDWHFKVITDIYELCKNND